MPGLAREAEGKDGERGKENDPNDRVGVDISVNNRSVANALNIIAERLIIASRESRLAMWQARHVQAELSGLYPSTLVEILGMTTQGDRILDVTLSKIGGKGLFVKELETALEQGRADLAVHSAKDIPMVLPGGFAIGAVMQREDPRDCLVAAPGRAAGFSTLAALPDGARVGTASLRREAQIRGRHPRLQVVPVRGNLDTRLAKLDRGEFDVLVLAAAGLIRLGLGARISVMLSLEESLPAPGQGALAIEYRADRPDVLQALSPLDHADTAACVCAERALSRALSGSCQLPLAAYAEIQAGWLRLRALVAMPDGTRMVRAEMTGAPGEAEAIGAGVADELLRQGAGTVLAALA